MKVFVLAALFACAAASIAPAWPRLPLDLMLKGRLPKGVAPEGDKIYGGAEVDPNSLPFQVALKRCFGGLCSLMCGGSILDAGIILNAAHCVDGMQAQNLQVVAGEHSISQTSGNEQTVDVARYVQHENYNTRTIENDISLIFLASDLQLGDVAQRIELPKDENTELAPGTTLTVSGWGTTDTSGGQTSDVLRSVDVPSVSDDECRGAYGQNAIKNSMLCAGNIQDGGVDSCQGDSGGPLFANENGKFIQYGIVSWGQGCAVAGFPGVYTELSYFLNWIANNRN